MNINRADTQPLQTQTSALTQSPPSRSYSVQSGDSLWQIAQRELGNGDAWPELYAQNREAIGPDPNRLQPGTVLQIQGRAVPVPVPRPASATESADNSYTVKAGDSLWKIAERELGNGKAWPELYALNQETIGASPDRLQPGMVLQLRPADPAASPEAPAETLPADAAPPPAELPAEGSAAPSVTLIDETPAEGASEQPASPTVIEADPSVDEAPEQPASPTVIEADPSVDEAPEQPASPTVIEADPSVDEAPEQPASPTVIEADPSVDEAPEQPASPAVIEADPSVDEAPEQPASPAVSQETAPEVSDQAPILPQPPAADSPPVISGSPEALPAPAAVPEAPAHPAVEQAPEVDATPPASPLQTQVEALLATVDRRGQSAAVHADPVGGIPQVIRATDQLLSLYNSGELSRLPEGPARSQAEAWVLDAAAARTGKALQGWSGFAEAENQALIQQLQSPAFQALPAERQERLVQQAALSHEILSSLPDLRPDQQQVLQALAPWLGAAPIAETPPAPPIPAAEAPPPVAAALPPAEPTTAEATPAVPPAPPVADSPPEPAEAPAMLSEAPAMPPAPPAAEAPPTPPSAETTAPMPPAAAPAPPAAAADSPPQLEPSPAESLQASAEALLARIDGKGYTPAHHGDPVGGIPQVARAMTEVLDLVNSGEHKILADSELQQRLESWASEIATARFSREAQRWDGFSEGQAAGLNQQLNSAAFKALPAERQHQLLQPLALTYDIARSLPNAGPETRALLNSLQPLLEPQLGHAAAADTAPAEVETAASSPEYQHFAETLARKSSRWGSFSHSDKAALLKQQAEAVWQAQPAERGQLALELARNDQHALAGELLSREAALAAELMSQPGFPAVRLLDNLKDPVAIDLMLGLAQRATPEAEKVLADTLEAFDAFFSFQDRKAPFAQLSQSPAFGQLSPELQTRIRDFVQ